MKNWIVLRLILIFSILIFFYSQKALAQHEPINVGDNITGALAFPGDVNGYTFCSAADVPIYIKASSPDITFLRIELYNEMGSLIASALSVNATKILEWTTGSGQYTILVKSQNGDDQGEYFLSLQRTINPVGATALNCNSATINSLSAVSEPKPFTFNVSAGTSINLTLSSAEITFVRMELYNPLGQEIASSFSVNVAEIQIALNEAGCYTLLVMSHNCDEMGSFSLAQNITMGQCVGVCPVNEICGNQIDDDGDGLIDCQDEDCCNFYVTPVADIGGTLEFCAGENSVLTASGGTSYAWSTGANTPSIIVSNEGTYTVTITSDNGCTDAKSVNVVVLDLPVAVINGSTMFCEGENAILTASGGVSYAWNTGINTAAIMVNATNTYSVVVTNNNGCTDAASVNVIVYDLPVASIAGNTELCEGEISTLTANGGASYFWSTGVNVASINVFASGNYAVTVTDGNACTDSETVSVIVHDSPAATIDGDLQFCDGESTTLIANGGASYIWNTGQTNPIINVTSANNYSVSITDNNGCTDTASVNVIVYDLPDATIDGDLDFCEGESSILTAGGGISYEWSTGSNASSINVVAENNYVVTVTNLNGCTNTEAVMVIVYDLPFVDFELMEDNFCIDDPIVQLAGGSPLGGNYSGIGVVNNTFDPTLAGIGAFTLTYTYADGNGCSDSESIAITVVEDCSVDVDDVSFDELIEIFPNPSNGDFVIRLTELTNDVEIQLFTINGQEIVIDEKSNDLIFMSGIPKGIYFVTISSVGFQKTKKIIIQ